jgi:hypothetical protein
MEAECPGGGLLGCGGARVPLVPVGKENQRFSPIPSKFTHFHRVILVILLTLLKKGRFFLRRAIVSDIFPEAIGYALTL